MKTCRYRIKGLDCANCANELERALQKIDIINNVSISFMMERLSFECSEENENEAMEKIRKIVKKEEPDASIEEL